jgi:hypothetical protein
MWYKLNKIYVGTQQVRPSGWQPWANTIAYYPLNSTTTVNDMKGFGTSYNLTASGTGVAYDTLWAIFTWWDMTLPSIPESPRTVSFWFKVNNWGDGNWRWVLNLQIQNPSTNLIIQWTYSTPDNIFLAQSDIPSAKQWSLTGRDDGKWKLWTYVWENNSCSFYMNWEQIGTANSWSSMPSNPLDWTLWRNVWNWHQYCNISELIIENKSRTATEISNYYNLTKSSYWL